MLVRWMRSTIVRLLLVIAAVGVILATAPTDVTYAGGPDGTTVTKPSKPIKPIIGPGDDDG